MMWSPVQKLFHPLHEETPRGARVPAVPLRRKALVFSDIILGSAVTVGQDCPLPQLRGQSARVEKIRHYRFGDDSITNFRLLVNGLKNYSFSVAEDDLGQYLAISRELSAAEQDRWFGLDALGFFTEPSTAKTIRCKIDLATEAAWAAEKYVKSVDWVEGRIVDGRQQTSFHYNLLVNDTGEKALEIEHFDVANSNKIYVTVYRPIEDVVSIADPSEMPAPPIAAIAPTPLAEPPLFAPTIPLESKDNQPMESPADLLKTKPDFRRHSDPEPEIHIMPTLTTAKAEQDAESPPLPSFLLSREHNYLSLDAVLSPETERVRCGLMAAKTIIDKALQRGVRVRDVLRELVGLDSMLSEEVIFEMPLSDADYRALAMRYKLRPDHRDAIRARMQKELRIKLLGLPE